MRSTFRRVSLKNSRENITSSKPATLHDAINMAPVNGRAIGSRVGATRIGKAIKRKCEITQRNPNNNNYNNNNRNRNNNYHQQQNRRQETARAYAAVPAEGKVYAGNLPKCNRCNFHHSGQCPPKCQKCQKKLGHLEKELQIVRPLGTFVQEAMKPAECGARARAYAVVENPASIQMWAAGYYQDLSRISQKDCKAPHPVDSTRQQANICLGRMNKKNFPYSEEKLCNAPYHDGRFASHLWQALQKALEFVRAEMKIPRDMDCEVWKSHLLVQNLCKAKLQKRFFQIRKGWITARKCRQEKAYADKRRKPLEFEVGDRVLLKVSPWKGVVRFGKKGKLAPRSLCYPTNDRNDLGKMKPKADIGIFIGYSESSRGFRFYNHRTRKIMETIHMKFNELTTTASECNTSGRSLNCLNFQDSSEDSNETSSKEDLDNMFGPLFKEYYKTRSPQVSTNSAANTLNNEDTPSSSLIIVEENEAPQIVSSSEEPITNEATTPISNDNANDSVQEDTTELDKNTFINPFCTPVLEKVESSSTNQDPLNMHEFYQQNRSIDKWTKNHPLEQVIGDPSKPVMTRSRL
ncbi:hypothetical protein Tco_1318498 [Tanacetum coccineum]